MGGGMGGMGYGGGGGEVINNYYGDGGGGMGQGGGMDYGGAPTFGAWNGQSCHRSVGQCHHHVSLPAYTSCSLDGIAALVVPASKGVATRVPASHRAGGGGDFGGGADVGGSGGDFGGGGGDFGGGGF